MTAPELSVVVPVFNNARTLAELIERVRAVLDRAGVEFEMIAVDDGSTDGSRRLIEAQAGIDPRVRLLPLARNFGGQAALCAGFDAVRGARTVCLDADLENAPEDIPLLLAALDAGADLACGVRATRDRRAVRRISSGILNAYVRRQLRTPVADVGCGMRAMSSSIAHGLDREGDRRRLLTPLLVDRASKVVEVPLRASTASRVGGHYASQGVPSLPQVGSSHSMISLAAIALDYFLLSARHPFVVSGVVAMAAIAVGVVLAAMGTAAGQGALLLAGVVLACTGALGALLSLMGAYLQRLYQLDQGEPLYRLEPGADESEPASRRPGLRAVAGAARSPDDRAAR